MNHRTHAGHAALAALAFVVVACSDGPTAAEIAKNQDYEVWLIDQSNSAGQTFGGTLYIHSKAAIAAATGALTGTPETIDLGAATNALCLASTGANAVRPHMLMFNASHSHAILTFVASAHVVIFNAPTRTPLACLRMSVGAGAGRQAHAAMPAPDDSYILVANQNGKLLERINTNYATNQFTLDAAATLNLATCTTPSGVACEAAATRPDNAPIVPVVTSTSALAYVTLRGGGLFVVDPKATPMMIRAEYDSATIRGSGLTGVQSGSNVVVNGGLGVFAYRLVPGDVAATNAPNNPTPTTLIADAATTRDGHGMSLTGQGRFVWITDRGTNVAEVIEVLTGQRQTVSLVSSLSADPAPDLTDVSPAGDLLFVALRGPIPLSGGTVATGGTPGLGVVKISDAGDGGALQAVFTISNLDVATERADAHAVRVRRKSPASALQAAAGEFARLVRGDGLMAQTPAAHSAAFTGPASNVRTRLPDVPQECDHGTVALTRAARSDPPPGKTNARAPNAL